MTTVITAIMKTMYQITWWVKVGCGMVDLSTPAAGGKPLRVEWKRIKVSQKLVSSPELNLCHIGGRRVRSALRQLDCDINMPFSFPLTANQL